MTWKTIQLRELLTERANRFKPSDKSISDLKRVDKIDFSGNIHLSYKPSNTDMILIRKGDLLISGINVHKGAIAVYEGDEDVLATIHYSCYQFDDKKISIDFLKSFLRSENFLNAIKQQVPGGIKTEIKAKHLLPLKIFVPTDVDEQVLIVEQYLEKEAQILAVQAELQTQQTLLTKLRQSILQEAVQGKLTERWRAERKGFERTGASQVAGLNPAGDSNNDNETANKQPVTPGVTGSGPVRTATGSDETGAELLARIRAEKAELIRQGKLRKEKPLPPITDAEKPFDLPDGWVWCRLGEVAKDFANGLYKPESFYGSDGVISLRMFNIQNGDIVDLDKARKVRLTSEEISRYKIDKFDLLINRVNSAELIGKTGIVLTEDILVYESMNMRLKLFTSSITAPFVNKFLLTKYAREYFAQTLKKAANQVSINQTIVANTIITLPPLAEQQAIVAQVEKALAQVSKLEAENQQQQAEVGQLMQTILREAFTAKEMTTEVAH